MVHDQLPKSVEQTGHLLAIFPIDNFIAFPQTFVPLHIFESRYRQMVDDIDETEDKSFVLTNLDRLTNRPIDIGIFSQILSIEKLSDGRSNILVRCNHRVKITDYFRPYSYDDYAIGEIESLNEISKEIEEESWNYLFPSMLSGFKRFFNETTRREISRIAEEEAPNMSTEEIVNTMCQYSPLAIGYKIDLLRKNSILERAKLLERLLSP